MASLHQTLVGPVDKLDPQRVTDWQARLRKLGREAARVARVRLRAAA